MKIGGVIKINNKFLMVVGLLFLLLFVRFVCADDNLLENLAVEDPLYYDKDTFEPKVYNSKTLIMMTMQLMKILLIIIKISILIRVMSYFQIIQ